MEVAASISALVAISIELTKISRLYITSATGVSKTIRNFDAELKSFRNVLEAFEVNVLQNADFTRAVEDGSSAVLSSLDRPDDGGTNSAASESLMDRCQFDLNKILRELKRKSLKRKSRRNAVWGSLVWPFSEDETQKYVERLHRYKSIFDTSIVIDTLALVAETRNVVRDAEREEEERRILDWLSRVDFKNKQDDIASKRHCGTGSWLLESGAFVNWYDGSASSGNILWCPGDPGVGKTFIFSLVVEHILKVESGRDSNVAYVYCEHDNQANQSPVSLVRSLIRQLVEKRHPLPEAIETLYRAACDKNSKPTLDTLRDLLIDLGKSSRKTFVLIDALDESDKDQYKHRKDILDVLSALKGTPIRVLVTSRLHASDITKTLSDSSRLDIVTNAADIKSFLSAAIEEDDDLKLFCAEDDALKNSIIMTIMKNAGDQFLLPALHIRSLEGSTCPDDVTESLKNMTDARDQAYNGVLDRIRLQPTNKGKLAINVLMWVAFSKRSLQVEELREALAVEVGRASLNDKRKPPAKLLSDVCLGLVSVEEKSQTVRLFHYTVQDWLLGRTALFASPEITMSSVCLTYLSFDIFRSNLHMNPYAFLYVDHMLDQNPLLDYSFRYWGDHVGGDAEDVMLKLAPSFLTQEPSPLFAYLAFEWNDVIEYDRHLDPEDYVSILHIVTQWCLPKITSSLLTQGAPINSRDSSGRCPLHWATSSGHSDTIYTVKVLYSALRILAMKQSYVYYLNETTFSLIFKIKTVELLYPELRIMVMKQSYVYYLNETIFRLTLKITTAIILYLTLREKTMKQSYVYYLNETIFRLIFKIKTVELLYPALRKEAMKQSYVYYLNETIFRLIFKIKTVELLYSALRKEAMKQSYVYYLNETIFRLIFKIESVELLYPALRKEAMKQSMTSLSYAAKGGYETVVRLLLERDDVQINTPDQLGGAPLSYAARNGHEAFVRLLLERDDIQVNIQDEYGQTPLALAVKAGAEAVVAMLLKHEGVQVDSRDKYRRTPLFRAVFAGNDRILCLLLDQKAELVDIKDDNGWTPLSYMVQRSRLSTARLLLERGARIDSEDSTSRSPLDYAFGQGRRAMVRLLLAWDKCSCHTYPMCDCFGDIFDDDDEDDDLMSIYSSVILEDDSLEE
ncbi:MAG: hypothetical protein M1825_002968 [Sarcosagium campestre]|nr:MAG: hypothetical protein M1825_002968 [Sarcosagium campestre]